MRLTYDKDKEVSLPSELIKSYWDGNGGGGGGGGIRKEKES